MTKQKSLRINDVIIVKPWQYVLKNGVIFAMTSHAVQIFYNMFVFLILNHEIPKSK